MEGEHILAHDSRIHQTVKEWNDSRFSELRVGHADDSVERVLEGVFFENEPKHVVIKDKLVGGVVE